MTVFERLSQKSTIASMGHRVTGARNTNPFRSKETRQHDVITSTTGGRKMAMDKRISMLDDLEIVEQTWLDREDEDQELDDMLDELLATPKQSFDDLDDSTITPNNANYTKHDNTMTTSRKDSSNSQKIKRVLHVDNVLQEETIIQQDEEPPLQESIFERLYRHETRASIGQQVEFIRQQTLRRRQQRQNQRITAITTNRAKVMAQSKRTNKPVVKSIVSVDTTASATTCASTTAPGEPLQTNNETKSGSTNLWPSITSREYTPKTSNTTPTMICTVISDDSSSSTVSSLLYEEEAAVLTRNIHDEHNNKEEYTGKGYRMECLPLPMFSVAYHGPWKMTLTPKSIPGKKVSPGAEPLYLRSMSNILYDFGIGGTSEEAVATELVTALFHRDFECAKYWTENEPKLTTTLTEMTNEYEVEKSAESWSSFGGAILKATSAARIKFDHAKRVVIVIDYHHSVESHQQ